MGRIVRAVMDEEQEAPFPAAYPPSSVPDGSEDWIMYDDRGMLGSHKNEDDAIREVKWSKGRFYIHKDKIK